MIRLNKVAEARSRENQIDLMSVFIDAVQYRQGQGFGSKLDLNHRKFGGDAKAFGRAVRDMIKIRHLGFKNRHFFANQSQENS